MPGAVDAQRRRTRLALGATAVLLTAACGGGADARMTSGSRAPLAFDETAWTPPTEASIPNDPLGVSIRRGLALVRFTPESLPRYATSALRCTSCHQNDGLKATSAPLTGSYARFPKYLTRTGAVIGLADRVNYCFTRSLAGNALPVGSREMEDILAYIAFISRGVPIGAKMAGAAGLVSMRDTLTGDIARGGAVFARTCVVCHQADGTGNGPVPALWGPRSFSIGASMAREERAASFIFHNMPQSAPGTLSAQDAFDLAAFIDSHPRPDSPGKSDDWPAGGAPPDVPYATRGHASHRPPASLLPRLNPVGALVPPPAEVRRAMP
jgi:thiosulfate dehydrogenase